MTEQDIVAALEVCEAASSGPKRWVTNVPGTDGKSVAEQVSEMFAKQDPVKICHGVAMPLNGQPVESLDGGEALYLCLTGNGPTSAANARYIAGSFDPVAGWEAALREVRRLQRLHTELLSSMKLRHA